MLNHIYAWFRRDEDNGRHWLLGDQWTVMATVRGKHRGTIMKGWWHVHKRGGGLTDYAEIEVALGGEDSMLQAGIVIPFVGRAHVGVKVPRSWLNGWIYQRRELLDDSW